MYEICKVYCDFSASGCNIQKREKRSKMVCLARTQAEREVPHVQISLRAVVPVLSRDPMERVELEEDLQCIACHGLLTKLWNLKDKNLVRKLLVGVANHYDLTVQAKPKTWTAMKWRETYDFKAEGHGMASRINTFLIGQSKIQ